MPVAANQKDTRYPSLPSKSGHHSPRSSAVISSANNHVFQRDPQSCLQEIHQLTSPSGVIADNPNLLPFGRLSPQDHLAQSYYSNIQNIEEGNHKSDSPSRKRRKIMQPNRVVEFTASSIRSHRTSPVDHSISMNRDARRNSASRRLSPGNTSSSTMNQDYFSYPSHFHYGSLSEHGTFQPPNVSVQFNGSSVQGLLPPPPPPPTSPQQIHQHTYSQQGFFCDIGQVPISINPTIASQPLLMYGSPGSHHVPFNASYFTHHSHGVPAAGINPTVSTTPLSYAGYFHAQPAQPTPHQYAFIQTQGLIQMHFAPILNAPLPSLYIGQVQNMQVPSLSPAWPIQNIIGRMYGNYVASYSSITHIVIPNFVSFMPVTLSPNTFGYLQDVNVQEMPEAENYEALLGLAEALGEAIPRGLPRVEIDMIPSYRFNAELHRSEQTSCVICICDFEAKQTLRILRCGHEFHARCIDTWLRTNRTCPICRGDATPQSFFGQNEI